MYRLGLQENDLLDPIFSKLYNVELILDVLMKVYGFNWTICPHYTLVARKYLDEIFPSRWIGRRGQIEWPA